MADYVAVAKVGDIPEGEGRCYPVNGTNVAIFFTSEGEYQAINDSCPHAGASLAPGHLEGDTVHCPWHAWQFCTKTGNWLDNPSGKIKVDSYPVRVVGDDIEVLVDHSDKS